MNIKNIYHGDIKLNWSFDEKRSLESLGTPLVIQLDDVLEINDTITIKIEYETTHKSGAIQWLTKEMTLGKRFPFMFTQCESAYARSMTPCQDTPSSKVQVEAFLKVLKPLVALYSGKLVEVSEDKQYFIYHYIQDVVVPTYLIAIAVGKLEYRSLGERTGVWAEVEMVGKAEYEFVDTEKFVEIAEQYVDVPYEWGVYNILVLPTGFPFGGMENPNLTFVSPSIIAGDRSLANVIAHEIAHSWTGNLVTNKNWRNFWMNEGFTVFLERKINQILYGKDIKNLMASVGYAGLLEDINKFGKTNSYTSLNPDIGNSNPDESFSTVPYEKGYTFLTYLESLVGETKFQTIFRGYIKKFKYQTVTTQDFQSFFTDSVHEQFNDKESSDILSQVDWENWINQPGEPWIIPKFSIYYHFNLRFQIYNRSQ